MIISDAAAWVTKALSSTHVNYADGPVIDQRFTLKLKRKFSSARVSWQSSNDYMILSKSVMRVFNALHCLLELNVLQQVGGP